MSGAVLGFLTGGLFGSHWAAKDWPFFTQLIALLGDIFMNLLRMLVVPFVVTSMILGMTSMGKNERVGRLFGVTFAYYMVTTILAVLVGIAVVLAIDPGTRSPIPGGVAAMGSSDQLLWYEALFKTIRSLFPDNIFQAAAQGQILGLITFSLIFGGILNKVGEKGALLVKVIDVTNDVLMIFVRGVIWLAPLGIFGLVASKTGAAGGFHSVISDLKALSWYSLTVMLGLGIHAFIILPLLLVVVARKNPLKHLRHFAEAIVTAFSTSSSAATLPVTTSNAIQ
ncbi:dicarboxylate/amino acid:cation symporter, partial [Myxococcota bacterium]|nr:dicarboxylate/amino acid:cation symporter [Myxococcota bacterium]